MHSCLSGKSLILIGDFPIFSVNPGDSPGLAHVMEPMLRDAYRYLNDIFEVVKRDVGKIEVI